MEKTYEETGTGIEMILRAVCGDPDPEESADLREQQLARIRVRRNKASKNAQVLLREANRPVRRRDLLGAMDVAILGRMDCYEQNPDTRNAILLLGLIICKNILTDGPLHEED